MPIKQDDDLDLYALHLKQECPFDCAFCLAHAVKINWDDIELLCADAPWREGPRPKPKREGKHVGRPYAADPLKHRAIVLLTADEHERLRAYAAERRDSISAVARRLLMGALEQTETGGATPGSVGASEGASYEIPWERRER